MLACRGYDEAGSHLFYLLVSSQLKTFLTCTYSHISLVLSIFRKIALILTSRNSRRQYFFSDSHTYDMLIWVRDMPVTGIIFGKFCFPILGLNYAVKFIIKL